MSPLNPRSPFSIHEESPGIFRVYVFSCGLYPTGTREDAERLLRSLEYDRSQWNAKANEELAELRSLLGRAVQLFGAGLSEGHLRRGKVTCSP